jgi:ATP-binding protein involved in chromosome partitioning
MPMPLEIIGLGKREVRFVWDDGSEDLWGARELRLRCSCANCQSEATGERLLDPKTVRPDVSPRVISSIGNYAIGIDWNDGHNSGIYSFDYLRSLGEHAAGKMVENV